MLSVLIPTLRFDPSSLVHTLHTQLQRDGIPFEIRIADDAVDSPMGQVHKSLMAQYPCVHAVIRDSNLGAFANRKMLAKDAQYPRLLFLDEDALIPDDFIRRYRKAIEEHGNVVLGGARFPASAPDNPHLHLRWKVGVKRESPSAIIRQRTPYAGFVTCNFIIDAEVITKLSQHPEVRGYGHEDTMMGYDLHYAFIPVVHLDNPIGHAQIDSTAIYLQKTRTAVANLARLIRAGKIDEDVTLYRFFRRIEKSGTTKLLAGYIKRNSQRIERTLSRANPPLRLFDLYKLGWLCEELNQNPKRKT